jgi:hypothetical protein
MAALVTQADLTARFTATRVKEVFCDDGGGTIGPRLATSLAVGSRDAEAELLRAWPSDKIQTLVDGDEAIKAAVCDLVLADGMSGRPQWQGEGSPVESMRKTALDKLKAYAAAEKRSKAEAEAGANPNARVGIVTTGRPESTFVFAPNAASPRPRGF